MPETTQEPALAPTIETHPVIGKVIGPIFRSISALNVDKTIPTYETIKSRAQEWIAKVRAATRGVNEETFQAVTNLVYGPWIMSEDKLTGERATEVEKETNARLQHQLVHLLIYAQGENASKDLQARVWGMMKELEDVASGPVGKKYAIGRFLNGVRAETAIIRTLMEGGYRVYVPDYEKESDRASGQYSETYEWDVKNGVDLVAISPTNETLLIDAKGRAFEEYDVSGHKQVKTGVEFDGPTRVGDTKRLPESLRQHLIKYQKSVGSRITSIKRVTIMMPTHSDEMGRLGRGQLTDGSMSYHDALNRFGKLSSENKTAIMNRLNNHA